MIRKDIIQTKGNLSHHRGYKLIVFLSKLCHSCVGVCDCVFEQLPVCEFITIKVVNEQFENIL